MHGASEKQRRDRMNVLVEELRVLGASRCYRACQQMLS